IDFGEFFDGFVWRGKSRFQFEIEHIAVGLAPFCSGVSPRYCLDGRMECDAIEQFRCIQFSSDLGWTRRGRSWRCYDFDWGDVLQALQRNPAVNDCGEQCAENYQHRAPPRPQ